MADGKIKGLRVVSDRELLRRMYSHRAVPPCTPEAREEEAALEAEWWRRAWALRGPFKRGRLARHREQRDLKLARLVDELEASVQAAEDPAAPLSAAERARLVWGGKAGKGEPS